MIVSRGVRLGYGVGSFCTATFGAVPGLLLLYYMTNFLAVPAWFAGVVVAAPKVWDLVVNPLVGRWSDHTVSRMGPRRPWMLAGACTLPLAFALLLAGPPLTGVPAAGVFTGLWTAIESAVSAFGGLIFGAVLTMGGFVSSDPGRPVLQPDSAITAVLLGQTAVPAFIIFLAVLMTFRYQLTADHVLHDPQQPSTSGEIRPAAP
ncbi:hypothetical protein GCM10010404_16880 [Nonomuraea africana]|uniref:Na+/melibiose symporter-like transporter n=1 Tax=Nonomuraea africana TaxID=46171 RepID=A0ABR9KMH3_9ACTN|nr:MFS transporter [Nonomuraea africana]MBE1562976.1 Na+/melibiose symporter-like transporter [Nonomuraea africana]